MRYYVSIIFGIFLMSNMAYSQGVSASVNLTTAETSIGNIVFTDTPNGLLITPNLSNLNPGLHGLHLHQHPNCGSSGMSAGGHYDPLNTNSHQGPYGNGHLGDLPVIYVTPDGSAQTTTLAPRLKVSDLNGLTIMIHENGDNYTDTPPLGGGGARVACGIIK